MSGKVNFRDNDKYTNSRTDIYNPSFGTNVDTKGKKEGDKFEQNLDKYVDFVSWARWNLDLFLDLITPETGGIRLDLDQRVFIRAMGRFYKTYATFPRGYGKTFCELLVLYCVAILYPDCNLSMSAQTKESSAKLIKEKHNEIKKFYPLMANEIVKENLSKDTAEILFTSGSKLDNLANTQSSKGLRRHRLYMEESALINNETYQDALEPIPNVPRRTIGKEAKINPDELSGQIHFLTTAYFKNSEYERSLQMVDLKIKILVM